MGCVGTSAQLMMGAAFSLARHTNSKPQAEGRKEGEREENLTRVSVLFSLDHVVCYFQLWAQYHMLYGNAS